MFEILMLTAISIVIYIFLLAAGFIFTETKLRLAQFKFLDFKPFSCRKCLTFWLIAFFAAIMLVCGQTYIAILEFIFAALTALAMTIEEHTQHELTDQEIRDLNK